MVETPEEAFNWTRSTEDAPDEAECIEIILEEGVPTEINGELMGPLDIINECNQIAGIPWNWKGGYYGRPDNRPQI